MIRLVLDYDVLQTLLFSKQPSLLQDSMNSTNNRKERNENVSDTDENLDQNEDGYEYESHPNSFNEMYHDEYEMEDEGERDESNSFDPFDSNPSRDNRQNHDGIVFSQEADDFFEEDHEDEDNEDQEDNEDNEDALNNGEDIDGESNHIFARDNFHQTYPFQPHQIPRQQFPQSSMNQRSNLQSGIAATLHSSGPVMSQLENSFFSQKRINASPSQYSQQRQSIFNAPSLPNSLGATKATASSDSDCIMLISSDEEVEVDEIKETPVAASTTSLSAPIQAVKIDTVENTGLNVDERTARNQKLETHFPALDGEPEVVILEARRALEDRMVCVSFFLRKIPELWLFLIYTDSFGNHHFFFDDFFLSFLTSPGSTTPQCEFVRRNCYHSSSFSISFLDELTA